MAASRLIRKWPLVVLCLLLLLGSLLLISTRPPKVPGGYEFVLKTSKDAPRLRVEYLSYGAEHELLTCGPKRASTFDVRFNRLVKWIGIQRYFTAVAYLVADHDRSNQEFVVYASFDDSPALPSLQAALTAYYVDEHQQRMPMQFAIGKSNRERTRHLIAWKVGLPTAPGQSCSVEVVEPRSGKQYAIITNLKAAASTPVK